MVSLSRTPNTNAGGATFFSESMNIDDEYMRPILESYGRFKPLRTIPHMSLHMIAAVVIEILAIVVAITRPDEHFKCTEYFMLIYAHVALWFLTLIIDQLIWCKHYALRMNGYLEFYRTTQLHHRLPLYIVSLWNAAILLLQAIMQHCYGDDFVEKCIRDGVLSPVSYFVALMTLELCVIFAVNIDYIISRFNKRQSPPDVQKDEWTSVSNEHLFPQGEVGVQQLGERAFDFIQKQADMIRYLKDHNARLGEKLVVLNAQLQARNST